MTLPTVPPQRLGLDEARWSAALSLADDLCRAGHIPALAMQFVRPDAVSGVHAYGRLLLSDVSRRTEAEAGGEIDEPSAISDCWLPNNAIFLTASLTKPIVAMAALRLVEQGRLGLNNRVQEFLPAFDDPPKRPITVRHLLTHTSGLPDMLPTNRTLRQSRASLAAFVEGTCGVSLDFPCGRGVQYQSLGFLLLGEIIARVSGLSCAAFLRKELFEPLGMDDTALGAPEEWFGGPRSRMQRIAEVDVPDDQQGGDDWNWNSRYWRTLGAPWGGLFSTGGDLSQFLAMMLGGGKRGDVRLFSPETVAAATSNQLKAFHDIPDADRRTRGWGYGWRLNWTAHSSPFAELLSPAAVGHWGATGTLMWLDPSRQAALVLLTTQPLDRQQGALIRLSNAVAAAIVD
jgi:CubicO group peptidase (beta-lactamase class C family)